MISFHIRVRCLGKKCDSESYRIFVLANRQANQQLTNESRTGKVSPFSNSLKLSCTVPLRNSNLLFYVLYTGVMHEPFGRLLLSVCAPVAQPTTVLSRVFFS